MPSFRTKCIHIQLGFTVEYVQFISDCLFQTKQWWHSKKCWPRALCYSEPVSAFCLTLCFYIMSCISCLLTPGCEAEDTVAGDECGELPFSGEQNEAHDSLLGAGERNLPEDHWTHALMPSLWHSDRCGDDPDQNWSQRESQNCSQKALTAGCSATQTLEWRTSL